MTDVGWAATKPTEAGWYWWRFREGKDPVVMKIGDDHTAKTNVFTIGTSVLLIDELPGEWLGPISPSTYHQGRVAGLKDAEVIAQFMSMATPGNIAAALRFMADHIEQQAQGGSDGN